MGGSKHVLDGCPIIVTENFIEYRNAAATYITSEDVVLEVGCAEGVTTALVAQKAKQAFGIDKSDSQSSKALQRYRHIGNLVLRKLDAWDLSSVANLAKEHNIKYTVILIDVSGSRKVGDVDDLITRYEKVFNPRLFVVKCYPLKRVVSRCKLHCTTGTGKLLTLAAQQQAVSRGHCDDFIRVAANQHKQQHATVQGAGNTWSSSAAAIVARVVAPAAAGAAIAVFCTTGRTWHKPMQQ